MKYDSLRVYQKDFAALLSGGQCTKLFTSGKCACGGWHAINLEKKEFKEDMETIFTEFGQVAKK